MCGIAEFRCRNLTLSERSLADIMNGFTYFHDKLENRGHLVVVTQYEQHCLCDPTATAKQQFLAIVRTLKAGAEDLVYSPNDYSDNLSECFLEQLSPEDAVERFWPSLETPPMRITIHAS